MPECVEVECLNALPVDDLLETLNQPEVHTLHLLSGLLDPQLHFIEDLLALVSEFIGHELEGSKSTQLVVVVEDQFLDQEIVIRDIFIPIQIGLE